jgi:hypothetical protein
MGHYVTNNFNFIQTNDGVRDWRTLFSSWRCAPNGEGSAEAKDDTDE